ncbi:MAG: site-specific integrase, partial [Phycisphaerales bacterium]
PVPRDGNPVKPVDEAALQRTVAAAHPMLRAMIELQLATAMRPGELVAICGRQIHATSNPKVFTYRVDDSVNKTEHFQRERTVFIGPRGMEILRPWLYPEHPDAPIFSPRRVMAMQLDARAAARKTPLYGARRRRGINLDCWRPQYDVNAYRHAINDACDRAHPHPEISAIKPRRRTAAQSAELERWKRTHRWHPHQLRHNAATYIAEHEAPDVAQVILGHASIVTTMRYITVPDRRAVVAALRLG